MLLHEAIAIAFDAPKYCTAELSIALERLEQAARHGKHSHKALARQESRIARLRSEIQKRGLGPYGEGE